jgi:hypothetical protein
VRLRRPWPSGQWRPQLLGSAVCPFAAGESASPALPSQDVAGLPDRSRNQSTLAVPDGRGGKLVITRICCPVWRSAAPPDRRSVHRHSKAPRPARFVVTSRARHTDRWCSQGAGFVARARAECRGAENPILSGSAADRPGSGGIDKEDVRIAFARPAEPQIGSCR